MVWVREEAWKWDILKYHAKCNLSSKTFKIWPSVILKLMELKAPTTTYSIALKIRIMRNLGKSHIRLGGKMFLILKLFILTGAPRNKKILS